MPILQNSAISLPIYEFLVAFSQATSTIVPATRRTIIVRAETPQLAKRICRLRYPRSLHLQVFPRSAACLID